MAYLTAAIGVAGSLGGTTLGWFLGSWSQKRAWFLNSRKEEWRELISTLERCKQAIREAKATIPFSMITLAAGQAIRDSQLEGARVIRDRLFISEVLKKNKVKEDWDKIQQISNLATYDVKSPVNHPFTVSEFDKAWSEMYSKLTDLIEKDFKLKLGN